MQLLETIPGDSSPINVFETVAGDAFSIPQPSITKEQESELLDLLRDSEGDVR